MIRHFSRQKQHVKPRALKARPDEDNSDEKLSQGPSCISGDLCGKTADHVYFNQYDHFDSATKVR